MSESSAVVVIDMTGHHHVFDADDWHVNDHGYVDVLKDGKDAKPVATFPPGYIAVYRPGARRDARVREDKGGDAQ